MREIIKDRIEKIEQNIAPEGYKKTKIGIIPEDWQVKKLGEIAELSAGATPSTRIKEYWNGDIPWMSSGEINKEKIFSTEKYISKLGFDNSSTSIIPSKSVLIAIAGQGTTRGKVAINYIDLTTNQSLISLVNSFNKFNYNYLYFYLKKSYIKLRHVSTGTEGRRSLNMSIVKSFNIPIPPMEEQERIAEILTTWDEYIESLDILIEKKQEMKKGLMQKLLTGEKRLPGHTQPWQKVKLGDVAKLQNGYAFKSNKYLKNNGVPIIRISNIQEQIDIVNNIVYYSMDAEIPKEYIVKSGDLLIALSGATTGKTAVYKFPNKAYLNQRVGKFVTVEESLDNNYLIHYIQTNLFSAKLNLNLVAGAQPNISGKDIENIKLNLPPLDEQKAIADILSMADEEIDLLKKLRDLKKEEKKGLMQLLLTGIVRV